MVLFSDIPFITEMYGKLQPYTDAFYNLGMSCCIFLFKQYINTYTYFQQTYNHLYQDMEFKLCAQFDEASSAKGEDGIYRLLNGDFVLKFLPSSSANNKQLV